MTYHLRNQPERIVCLTEEPTEILYLLGEEHRIVGISVYTCRPLQAKENHPVVSAFISGSIKKIVDLKPDLIIGFSDIQAQLAKELITANQQVLIFNQRTIQEILDTLLVIGQVIGVREKAQDLVKTYMTRLNQFKNGNKDKSKRPRVYFEEWDDPKICGISWVSELIGLAGGEDIFADRAQGKNATDRRVKDEEILEADPEVCIGSWCGKPFDKNRFISRQGYRDLTAIKNNRIFEMDPSIILQPGPACLTDGLDKLREIIAT